MKSRPEQFFHIYPSEALREREFDFRFRRIDLLRTRALYSSDCAASDEDAEVGRLLLAVQRVDHSAYLARLDFSLSVKSQCCYCLEEACFTIADKARVELKSDDIDGSYPFTDHQAFDCRFLFEEEVLLRAPLNPHHEGCSIKTASTRQLEGFVRMVDPSQEGRGEDSSTWRPFANIRSLVDN